MRPLPLVYNLQFNLICALSELTVRRVQSCECVIPELCLDSSLTHPLKMTLKITLFLFRFTSLFRLRCHSDSVLTHCTKVFTSAALKSLADLPSRKTQSGWKIWKQQYYKSVFINDFHSWIILCDMMYTVITLFYLAFFAFSHFIMWWIHVANASQPANCGVIIKYTLYCLLGQSIRRSIKNTRRNQQIQTLWGRNWSAF